MKRTSTEGTWDAVIRKIVWGVPVALVVVGLLILLFARLQPSYTATVKAIGETSYTPSRKMVRGTSSSYYKVMLEVEYIDRRGAPGSASVLFGTSHPDAIPKAGDQILISRGLSGMVTHPNRDLIGAGGGAAGIGALLLVLYLLTWLRMRRR
ncbi:MAG: hypothetical protein IJJ45_11215 [Clostridia bacterium]|nr:hypothetical protein [Clostridia bacterium]